MDKNQKAVEREEEAQTSAPASPAEQNQTPSEEVSEESQVQAPEEAEAGEDLDKLPDEPNEQARAFQRLRQEKKRLQEQLREKERRQSVFDELKPSYSQVEVQQAQSRVDINNFVDPATGQFQAHRYNEAVNTLIERNRRVAQQTASESAQQTYDEMRAKEKYPQLDPSSDQYDREFEGRVASQYFFDLYRGNKPSILRLAEKEAKYLGVTAQKKTAQVKEQETVKEQASLAPASRSKQGFAGMERREELSRRTRQGDLGAVVERMRNIKS